MAGSAEHAIPCCQALQARGMSLASGSPDELKHVDIIQVRGEQELIDALQADAGGLTAHLRRAASSGHSVLHQPVCEGDERLNVLAVPCKIPQQSYGLCLWLI